jgi:hypothetical protein
VQGAFELLEYPGADPGLLVGGAAARIWKRMDMGPSRESIGAMS